MNPDLDLTARLDALGRSLAAAVPIDPPAAFLAGVRHQHRLTLLRRAALAVLALALLITTVAVAYRSGQNSARTPARNSGHTELRTHAADDADDAHAPENPGLH